MKKSIFFAAIAAVALVSCTGKQETKAEETQEEAQEVVVEEQEGAVVVLSDDSAYRPDTKVEELTILDFNATWCGPCKMLHPVFAEAAQKYPNVHFVSVDIDSLPETATAFGVQAIPTVVIMGAEGEMERYVGTDDLLPAEKLDKIISDKL